MHFLNMLFSIKFSNPLLNAPNAYNRGSIDDKIHFLFNMYDVSHDKSVSKQELATLLNQIPKDTLLNSAGISADISPSSTSNENGSHEDPLALIADGEVIYTCEPVRT